jgi:hypothetical protein
LNDEPRLNWTGAPGACDKRSQFVADLIVTKLRKKGNLLERAAQRANGLRGVNRDMKDWEALNEYDA